MRTLLMLIVFPLIFVMLMSSCSSSVPLGSVKKTGYSIKLYDFRTYLPNLITMFFQVYKDGYPATNLTNEDFVLLDDNEEPEFLESYKVVKKAKLLNYSFKTVIAVDVSGSIKPDDIERVKEALRTLINSKLDFQEIAIITFAGEPELLINFTRDKSLLLKAVDEIERVPLGATSLYEAIIMGMRMWKDKFSIDGVTMGMMIVLTDGKDTSGAEEEEALKARGNKKLYTIGVGSGVDEKVLRELSNEGYLPIESYKKVVDAFKKVEAYIKDYVSSFYSLSYFTPRREGTHTVKLIVGDDSVERDYDASKFRDIKVDDIYVDVKQISRDLHSLKGVYRVSSVIKIDSGSKQFKLVNSLYTVEDIPDGLNVDFDYPSGEYDQATMVVTVPRIGKYRVEILDKKYEIMSKVQIDMDYPPLENCAVLSIGPDGISLIDISNPLDPEEIMDFNTGGLAQGTFIKDGYIYVANGNNGLTIINASNLGDLKRKGYLAVGGFVEDVYVSGNYAYLASGDAGLVTVDVFNASNPREMGRINIGGYAKDVYVSGNYAYVADKSNSLVVIDISNVATPEKISSVDLNGHAEGVYVKGNYAYVADGNNGLVIIDVSDVTNPRKVGHIDTGGYVEGVYVKDDYAYIADGDNGLTIADISNSTYPKKVGHIDTDGHAEGVYVKGNYAYVADGNNGLVIIDVSDVTNPRKVGHIDTGGYVEGVTIP